MDLIRIPEKRIVHGHGQRDLTLVLIRNRQRFFCGRKRASVFVQYRCSYRDPGIGDAVTSDSNVGRTKPCGTVLLFGMNKHAPVIDRNRICFLQPDMTDNAGTLIPPAFVISREDIDGNDIVTAEIGDVGDIDDKRCVSGVMVCHSAAVDPNRCFCRDGLKDQCDAAGGILGLQTEVLSVPCVSVGEATEGIVVLRVRGLCNDVIVRQGDILPRFTRKRTGCIPVVGIAVVTDRRGSPQRTACLCVLISRIFVGQRGLRYVAFMKMPMLVELDAASDHMIIPFGQRVFKIMIFNYIPNFPLCQWKTDKKSFF